MKLSAKWSNAGALVFAQANAENGLRGWSVGQVAQLAGTMRMLTFYAGREPIGAMVLHDGGVHVAVSKEWRGRWINKSVLSRIREAIGEARGALIKESNATARAFAERLGWHGVPVENEYALYRPKS